MARQTLILRFNRRLRLAAPLLVSAALLLVSSAHAELTAADKQSANALLAEGTRLRDADDPKAALEKFNAAHAILHSPKTGFEVAQALWQLGKLVEAREMVYRITQRPPDPGELYLDQKARADAKLAVVALDSRIPSIVLRIRGVPIETVTVTVDGNAVPAASLEDPLQVNPGKHEVVGTAKGYEPADVVVERVESESVPVKVLLTLKPKSASELEKDESPGGADSKGGPNKALLYAGIGVTGGLALVALGTEIGAAMKKRQADDVLAIKCIEPCKEESAKYEGLASTTEALGITSLVTLIGAGLVGGATFAYWIAPKKHSSESDKAPRPALVVMPGGGGFVVSGQW